MEGVLGRKIGDLILSYANQHDGLNAAVRGEGNEFRALSDKTLGRLSEQVGEVRKIVDKLEKVTEVAEQARVVMSIVA